MEILGQLEVVEERYEKLNELLSDPDVVCVSFFVLVFCFKNVLCFVSILFFCVILVFFCLAHF